MKFLDAQIYPLLTPSNTVTHGKGGIPFDDLPFKGFVGQVILCRCGFEEFITAGCPHASRNVPCSVATLVHSSPKVMLNLSKYLG